MNLHIDNEIINSILQDDLARFKRIHPCRFDTNRFLKPYEFLNPKDRIINSKQNKNADADKNQKIISKIQDRPIKGPTALIFSILCERPSFCKYIIEKTNADLSISLNGWTAFHFSCCTYDTRCLLILLHNEYIQQNIDAPIIAPTFPNNDVKKQSTTALHLAVSNRLYKTVLILTIKPLPIIKSQHKSGANDIANNNGNSNNNDNNNNAQNNDNNDPPNDDFDEESIIEYESCNVNIRATSGSTPLHIAIFNKDYEMCQILIHAGCDPSIKNDSDVTCIEYARRLELDDKFIKLMNDELEPEPIDVIIGRYFEGKEKAHFYDRDYVFDSDDGEDEVDEDQDQDLKNFVMKNAKDINYLSQILRRKEIDDKILRTDLSDIQAATKQLTEKPVQIQQANDSCCICGSTNARRCNLCGKRFCNICFHKKCHNCVV